MRLKKKISAATKNPAPPATEETRAKMSVSKKGRISPEK
jgi:hypothetical protein